MTALVSSRQGSGRMFDAIAGRYDVLNDLMSFGLCRWWRRRLIASLAIEGAREPRVLDVATGTASIALAIARAHAGARIVGLDPSAAMLEEGRRKADRAGLGDRIELVGGDAQLMPEHGDASFDACTIAYGIRNVPDRGKALVEMARVTRRGGRIAVLELTEPTGRLAPVARLWVHGIVPRLGAWLSGASEYAYLARSIRAFPPPGEFASLMEESGIAMIGVERLSFGAAHLFIGTPR